MVIAMNIAKTEFENPLWINFENSNLKFGNI